MITTSKAMEAIEIPAICAVVRGTGLDCWAGKLVAEVLWGVLLVDVIEGVLEPIAMVIVGLVLDVIPLKEPLDAVDTVDVAEG